MLLDFAASVQHVDSVGEMRPGPHALFRSIIGGLEKVCPVTSALVLLGAVSFTLMAAYQWAGRLGLLNAGPNGQVRALSTALAIILWLVWFFG
jgi:hypothetical protein